MHRVQGVLNSVLTAKIYLKNVGAALYKKYPKDR